MAQNPFEGQGKFNKVFLCLGQCPKFLPKYDWKNPFCSFYIFLFSVYDKNEIAVEDVNNFVNWATLQSMIEEAVNSNNLRFLRSKSLLLQFVSLEWNS